MAEKKQACRPRGGMSMSLLVVGLLALGISVWAFLGPAAAGALDLIPMGWAAVGAAIVAGVLLVMPRRRRKD